MGYYKDQLITQDCHYHEVQAYLLVRQILDYKKKKALLSHLH